MARKPRKLERDLTGNAVDVLNAIRNGASAEYQKVVPYATNDAAVIRKIGSILIDFPLLYNEFANGLINRVGKVSFATDMYWTFLLFLSTNSKQSLQSTIVWLSVFLSTTQLR